MEDFREKHYQYRFDEIEEKLEAISITVNRLYDRLITKQDFYSHYLEAEKRKLTEDSETLSRRTKIMSNLVKWGCWLILGFYFVQGLGLTKILERG